MYEDDNLATPAEASREYAWNAGADRPDEAWICSHFDIWESNPHYQGEPQAHPESIEY